MIVQGLILSTFSLFSLGQIGRLSFFGQQVNIYAYEISILLLLIVLFWQYRLKPFVFFKTKLRIIILFFLVLLLSLVFNSYKFTLFENTVGFLYSVRIIFYALYFLYLSYHIYKKKKDRQFLIRGFFIFSSLTIITTLAQYFLYPDLMNLRYLGWDPHYYRAFGLFLDTFIAGAIYGLIFLFFYFEDKELKLKPLFRFIFMVMYLVFIFLTYARSLYIAFIITIFFVLLKSKKLKLILLIGALFLSLFIFLPKQKGEGVNLGRFYSIYSRLSDYQTAGKIWLKKPFLGWGYNRIRYVKKQLNLVSEKDLDITHAGASFHSSFLIILVSAGIWGLLIFVLLLFKLAFISPLMMYSVLLLSLLSLTDNVLLLPFIIFILITFAVINPSRR
jgi:hypothetical protein